MYRVVHSTRALRTGAHGADLVFLAVLVRWKGRRRPRTVATDDVAAGL